MDAQLDSGRHGMKKKNLWIALILLIVLIGFFVFKANQQPHVDLASAPEAHNVSRTSTNLSLATEAKQTDFRSASQQDTQINCAIQRDAGNNLRVNQQTRDCFEYFLTQYGEISLEQIDQLFQRYAATHFVTPALAQLTDLWQRYLKYRQALGADNSSSTAHLTGSNNNEADKTQNSQNIDIASLQAAFAAQALLRQRFFSNAEIEGLFGTEDLYNRYTLDRLSIRNNNRLTEVEKARQLRERFEQLPEDVKANLKQLSTLEDLRLLTASIRKNGGSAQQLRDMRLNLVGFEATTRLEQLDAQRANWQRKTNEYLTVRQNILNSSMSDVAKQNAIVTLRKQSFQNPQEQLRIQSLEMLKDRGQALPMN